MNKTFIFLILIVQIAYINLSPIKRDKRKLDDKSNDIVIIHLNDVHCGLNDTIGYDGFVLYRDELKEKYNNVITVDVGDHIQGGTLGAITGGKAIIELMNKINFDVNIIGNHEFDYTIENLKDLNSDINTKYICANFCTRKDKQPIFEPYTILEVGGKKIAFIGVVTPLTFSKTYISTIRDNDGNPLYNFLADGDELSTTIQKYIDEVKNEKGDDYVILLTHIGMDVEDYTSNGLVSKLKDVDVVLDGHTHKVYSTTSKDLDNDDVYFTQTGTKLANIGELIIKTDGTISTRNIAEVPEPTSKDGAKEIFRGKANRWVNTDMNNFINDLWDRYSDELNIQIGVIDYDLLIRPEETTDSHAIYCRFKECTLGNLVADPFKDVVSADISLLNGGAIRDSLLKGDITRKDILNIMPFFNSIYVKIIDGKTLLDTLEFGVSKLPNAFGGFPQVSGITYDVNTSISTPVVTDSDGMFLNIKGERRVSNVKVNGKNLDINKNYTISASEYILNGGDGYTMLSLFPIIQESIFTDSDALIYYIMKTLNETIPVYYKNELGRINIDKEADTNENNGNSYINYLIPAIAFILICLLIAFIKN